MSAEEPNSHVIIRRVTKAWEFKDRRLRYYDFEKDEFDFDSSRFLLTADTSYGVEVEKLLNLHIETHLASYLHTIATYPLAKDLPPAPDRGGGCRGTRYLAEVPSGRELPRTIRARFTEGVPVYRRSARGQALLLLSVSGHCRAPIVRFVVGTSNDVRSHGTQDVLRRHRCIASRAHRGRASPRCHSERSTLCLLGRAHGGPRYRPRTALRRRGREGHENGDPDVPVIGEEAQ
jgi:hypothetical protein